MDKLKLVKEHKDPDIDNIINVLIEKIKNEPEVKKKKEKECKKNIISVEDLIPKTE